MVAATARKRCLWGTVPTSLACAARRAANQGWCRVFDTVIADARVTGRDGLVHVGVRDGVVAAVEAELAGDTRVAADGGLVTHGLVDTHLHLDKSRILDRYGALDGTLAAAIRETARLKADFTEEDIYTRAAATVAECVVGGTTTIRAHVEVDAVVGLRAFRALQQLAADRADVVDIELCVFAQEGLSHSPEGQRLLDDALHGGAHAIGGAPYADADPHAQLDLVFAAALRHDVPVDLHLDFAESPHGLLLEEVCRRTIAHGLQGRVAVGHVTQLSYVAPSRHAELCALVADAGVAVTVLPATDLFLTGRTEAHPVPRGIVDLAPLLELGVTCSVATNNVLNAFTPFGDGSLLRMANLYANVAHADRDGLDRCFELVSTSAARLIGRPRDRCIGVGTPADLICLPAQSEADAVARIVAPRWGMKAGRMTFTRPDVALTA